MAYDLYLGNCLMPVTPSKVSIGITNQNKTLVNINDGEINLLKRPGLTEISFSLLLPNVEYPFAKYKSGFQKADYFLNYLNQLKENKKPFQFILTRYMGMGGKIKLFDTNIKVSLENYTVVESADNSFDVQVDVKLKQYKDYATKVVTLITPLPTAPMVMYEQRPIGSRNVSPSKQPFQPAKPGSGGKQCNPSGLNTAQVKTLQAFFRQKQTGCFDNALMNACKNKWGSAVGAMTAAKAWNCYRSEVRTNYEKVKNFRTTVQKVVNTVTKVVNKNPVLKAVANTVTNVVKNSPVVKIGTALFNTAKKIFKAR